jgi:hypothetical protein
LARLQKKFPLYILYWIEPHEDDLRQSLTSGTVYYRHTTFAFPTTSDNILEELESVLSNTDRDDEDEAAFRTYPIVIEVWEWGDMTASATLWLPMPN